MRVVGGRDEDSPATIYLIWLSWLHSKRSKFSETSMKWRKGIKGCWKAKPSVQLPRPTFHSDHCAEAHQGLVTNFGQICFMKFRRIAECGLTYLFSSSEISKLCDYVLQTNNKYDKNRTINK